MTHSRPLPFNLTIIISTALLFSQESRPQTRPQRSSVPDLRQLTTQPKDQFSLISQRYDADRSGLNRAYPLSLSPTRHARFTSFHANWLSALDALDSSKLSEASRRERDKLKSTIQSDLKKLEDDAKARAEIFPLLPFASIIIDLDE